MLEYKGILINKLIYMSLNNVEQAKQLSNAPLNKENTQKFLSYIDSNFPNWWEQVSWLRTIVLDFQLKLSNSNEQWAQDAYQAIWKSRNERWVLADAIRPSTTRNPVTLAWGRNISGYSPSNAVTGNEWVDIIENDLGFISSKLPEWVTQSDALELAYKYIGKPLTGKNIKEFQANQRIWIDTVNIKIWVETYGEMLAKELQQLVSSHLHKNLIPNQIQEDLIALSTYGTPWTENMKALAYTLAHAERELREHNNNFEKDYLPLFNTLRASWIMRVAEDGETVQTSITKVQEEFDKFNKMPTEEVIQKLSNTTEVDSRSPYISLLAHRFKNEWYIISPNDNNEFQILDSKNSVIQLNISQENIGAIMILMASTNQDIVADRLEKNIGNNIFDTVVKEFEFKRENWEVWKAQDFVTDDVRTDSDVEKNKAACTSQISKKITELKNSLSLTTTTDTQKQEIRVWIQKLEIAKIFVNDQSIIADNSLQIAHNISSVRSEVARMFGSNPKDWAKNAGAIEAWDVKSFMIGQTPRLIIAGLFALLTKLLPSPFKEAALAWIGGITGLGMYEDAEKRGLISWNSNNLKGLNSLNVTTASSEENADILRNILTNAPAWIESRHKTVYARIVEKNEEWSHIRERGSLDTIFLYLSQDYELGQKKATDLDDLSSTTVWDTMSEYSKNELMGKWISGENVLSFVRLLKADDVSDTSDENIEDLFVVGQVTDSNNKLDITWVNGVVFSDQNDDINHLISRLSGISFGANNSMRDNSVRAKAEEALAKAHPWVLSWMGQAVAERTNLVADQVPTAENVWEVLEALRDITAAWDDLVTINGLIAIYEGINTNLTLNESVHTYLAEASEVYTITGQAYRGLENTVYWVQGWGQTVPTRPGNIVTPAMIDTLINDWEAHITSLSGNEDLKTDVTTAVENLRLYKIKMLDSQSRATGINSTERARLLWESDKALAEVIDGNPDVYLQTLRDLENQLGELKEAYISTDAYLAALSGNISELSTLQRLVRITTTNTEFETEATRIYDEVFTNGIAWNFKTHLESKNWELTTFTVSATDLPWIIAEQEAFDTIRDELLPRDWTTDIIWYFDITDDFVVEINGVNYVNIPASLSEIFKSIDPSFTPIAFDPSIVEAKQDELNTVLTTLGWSFDVSIPAITDVADTVQIDTQRDAIKARILEINSLPEAFRETKMSELKLEVSKTIDLFVTKIGTYWVSDTAEITILSNNYNEFIETDLGNTGNENFEDAYELKMQEITEYLILNTAIKDAPDTITPLLTEIAVLMGAWTIDASWNFIANSGHPFHRDVIDKVTTWITFAEMFAEIDSGILAYPTNIQTSINIKKWEIVWILAPGLPEISATWIRDTYGDVEGYLRRFYNTITQ